jgi:hypothetical protein
MGSSVAGGNDVYPVPAHLFDNQHIQLMIITGNAIPMPDIYSEVLHVTHTWGARNHPKWVAGVYIYIKNLSLARKPPSTYPTMTSRAHAFRAALFIFSLVMVKREFSPSSEQDIIDGCMQKFCDNWDSDLYNARKDFMQCLQDTEQYMNQVIDSYIGQLV